MSFLQTQMSSEPIVPVAACRAETHWYAAHTRPNHERRVAEQFDQRNLEQLLPLYDSVRQWKDRKVRLALPLFPGYVFVRMDPRERLRVLQVSGVVQLVGVNRNPSPISDEEIELLRAGLQRKSGVQPHQYLTTGCRVLIRQGPFRGLKGILLRQEHRARVVISLELLMRSIAVEVDTGDVGIIPIST